MATGAGAAAGTAATGITIGGIIQGILIAIAVLIGAGLGALLVGAALIFTGTPKPCVDREVPSSTAVSNAMRARWKAFERQAATSPASIIYTEEDITSRGVDYIDEKSIPVKKLQVYFCPEGYAEATGTVDIPGPDADVLVRGTLDLSGPEPYIDIQDIKIGNLPAFIGTRVVETALGDDWKSLDLKVRLTDIAISDGEVELEGGP